MPLPILAVILILVVATGVAADPPSIEARLTECAALEDADPQQALALSEALIAEKPALGAAQHAQAMGCRALALVRLGRREDAIEQARRMHATVETLPQNAERASLFRRAGAVLHMTQERLEAIGIYLQALADVEATRTEEGRVPLLVNLGVLHAELADHARATDAYQQALAIMAQTGDDRFEAPVRYNLAVMLFAQSEYQESRFHYERVLELLRASGMGGPQQLLSAEIGYANVLMRLGEADEGRALIERASASPLLDSLPSLRAQASLIEAGIARTDGDFPRALALLDGVAQEHLTDIQRQEWLQSRARILSALGRHEEATQMLSQYAVERDAFLRTQNAERLATLEARMADHAQRLELERLRLENTVQDQALANTRRMQNLTFAIAAALVLSALVVMLWQRRMNRRLDRLGRTDVLTGLPNRRDLIERMQAHAARRDATTGALLLADIDHFKRVNDRYGHDAGDRVLRSLAGRLDAFAASRDIHAARWGGEEFLLYLPNADQTTAARTAAALCDVCSSTIPQGGDRVELGISAGFAALPLAAGASDRDAWQTSLRVADAALRLAKGRGRGGWAGYWPTTATPDWPPDRMVDDPPSAQAAGALGLWHSQDGERRPELHGRGKHSP